MSTPTVDSAANVFADPSAYADEPRLHAALAHLRAQAPVALVDKPPYRPASHWLPLERTKEVNAALLDFLRGLRT